MQKIDGILYVPLSSIFKNEDNPKEVRSSKYGVNKYNYSGGWGVYYYIFPNLNTYVYERFSQANACSYLPYHIVLDYPIRKLYGEPMLPVYDYNTNKTLDYRDRGKIIVEYNTTDNILKFCYTRAYFNGS